MPPASKRWLFRLGSFALAGVLLVLALRDANFQEIGRALRTADYRWLLPLLGLTLLGHWCRAWRWRLLLRTLPGAPDVPTRATFGALVIGYMVNYAAPRLGEFARTGNLSYRHGLSFSGVLGTVVVERMLDVVVLLFGLLTMTWVLLDRSAQLQILLVDPLTHALANVSWVIVAGVAVSGLLLVLAGWYFWRRSNVAEHPLVVRLAPVMGAFRDGLLSVTRSGRPGLLLLTTIGIWVCYALMTYVPLRMLGIAQLYDLDPLDAWALMIIGAVGMALPSPGGAGTYHFFTIESMSRLFGVARTPAQTFAVLAHAAQMLFSLTAGSITLLIQGTSFREVQEAAEEAAEGAPVAEPQVTS